MSDESTNPRIRLPDRLSAEQRMNRICELLAKAVVADWTAQVIRESPTRRPTLEEVLPQSDTTDRQRILNYLALVGHATPTALRATLGLPRMRLYRAVQPMLANGRVVAKGHTSMVTYSLALGKGTSAGLN